MATDTLGNLILTGSYENTIDFGGGPLPTSPDNQAFVAEFSPAGAYRWAKGFVTQAPGSYGNGVTFDQMRNVVVGGSFTGTVDFGGGPLTSTATSNIFIAKYTPAGEYLWAKQYGEAGGDGGAYQIGVDAAGNIVVPAIYSNGAVDFGCGSLPPLGGYDALIAKLDPLGNCLWSKRFGDSAFQQSSAASADASGNVLLAGILAGTADFGGGPLTSAGGQDVFVAKFDPSGNYLWAERFGDASDQLALGVAVDSSGDAAVAGQFAGTLAFGTTPALVNTGGLSGFVAMLSPTGTPLWSTGVGGAGSDGLNSVAVDYLGNVCVTGFFSDTIDLGSGPLVSAGMDDVVVAKYDNAGTLVWGKRFGDPQQQVGNAVGVDYTGHVYISGTMSGTIDFGEGPLTSAGGADLFVAKLPP
jgi:hypothetical protein